MLGIAYASVVVGGLGELAALVELLVRGNNSWLRGLALAATVLLLGVVCFSPALGMRRAISGELRDNPDSTTKTEP
jgi:hypothetical protein